MKNGKIVYFDTKENIIQEYENMESNNIENIIYLKSIDINLDPSKNNILMNNRNNPEIRIFGNIP